CDIRRISHTPSTHTTSPLSLHDALPISVPRPSHDGTTRGRRCAGPRFRARSAASAPPRLPRDPNTRAPAARRWSALGTEDLRIRSEEHTSELQSRFDLVCRLLLEKKKKS